MLQKLEFHGNDNQSLKEGSLKLEERDGYILAMTVPEHEFWKGLNLSEDNEPHCLFLVKEIEPGIYMTGLNFEHSIEQYTDFKSVDSYERLGKDGLPKKYEQGSSMTDYFDNTLEVYGIADNVEQIKQMYQQQINSDNPIVISITEINKDDQPSEDGWRWEKWGKYIGNQNSQSQYIYDEPEIESVYVFTVHAVKSKLDLEKKSIIKPKM